MYVHQHSAAVRLVDVDHHQGAVQHVKFFSQLKSLTHTSDLLTRLFHLSLLRVQVQLINKSESTADHGFVVCQFALMKKNVAINQRQNIQVNAIDFKIKDFIIIYLSGFAVSKSILFWVFCGWLLF